MLALAVMYSSTCNIQTWKLVPAAVIMSFCTLLRSTGMLLTIIGCFYVGHKLFRNLLALSRYGEKAKEGWVAYIFSPLWNLLKGLQYSFWFVGTVVMVAVAPIFLVSFWKPYDMYCLSRLDTHLEVPPYCFDEFPNVYSYVQKLYWQVGWMGFLERPWYLTATSLFTNQLFLYIFYRTARGHGLVNFLTCGLPSTHLGEPNERKTDIFTNLATLPHAYVFLVNMLIVLLLANTEINSRVASTCPFYYYAFAQLCLEVRDEMRS